MISLNDEGTAEAQVMAQDAAEPPIAAVFAKSPFDWTERDVERAIAYYQQAQAKGHFRAVAHKAIKAGKPPPRQRKPALIRAGRSFRKCPLLRNQPERR